MGPWLQMAVFCFEVEEDGDERWPVGLMNEALFPPMPPPGPNDVPVFQFEANLFATFAADGAMGPVTIEAAFFSPVGEKLAETSADLEFAGHGIVTWHWPLMGTVGQLGTHWAEIRIGEHTVTRAPLEFRVQDA